MKILLPIMISLFLFVTLLARVPQQDFLDPARVRKTYRLKDFKTVLFMDDEVFPKNPALEETQFIEISGFRVQLVSTQDLNEALKIKAQADSLYNLPVYIDFESPNYKVRMGNYASNEEAQVVQKRMQNQGFKFAWVVPSKVIIVK